jgi:hypothetical protein
MKIEILDVLHEIIPYLRVYIVVKKLDFFQKLMANKGNTIKNKDKSG